MNTNIKSLAWVSLLSFMVVGTVSAGSIGSSCEQAAWRAFLSDAALNVVDDLGTYNEDLSAYGTPRPTPAIKAAQSTTAANWKRSVTEPVNAVEIDETLHAYFHKAALHPVDDLSDYGGDLSGSGQSTSTTVAEARR